MLQGLLWDNGASGLNADIWPQIFELLPMADLLGCCRLVCKAWSVLAIPKAIEYSESGLAEITKKKFSRRNALRKNFQAFCSRHAGQLSSLELTVYNEPETVNAWQFSHTDDALLTRMLDMLPEFKQLQSFSVHLTRMMTSVRGAKDLPDMPKTLTCLKLQHLFPVIPRQTSSITNLTSLAITCPDRRWLQQLETVGEMINLQHLELSQIRRIKKPLELTRLSKLTRLTSLTLNGAEHFSRQLQECLLGCRRLEKAVFYSRLSNDCPDGWTLDLLDKHPSNGFLLDFTMGMCIEANFWAIMRMRCIRKLHIDALMVEAQDFLLDLDWQHLHLQEVSLREVGGFSTNARLDLNMILSAPSLDYFALEFAYLELVNLHEVASGAFGPDSNCKVAFSTNSISIDSEDAYHDATPTISKSCEDKLLRVGLTAHNNGGTWRIWVTSNASHQVLIDSNFLYK